MNLFPISLTAKAPSSSDILYGVRYKALGKEYSFSLAKINEKFKCGTQQVLDAAAYLITNNTAPPDGPLKGMFIRALSNAESTQIRENFKQKEATIRDIQNAIAEIPTEFVIGTRLPDNIW